MDLVRHLRSPEGCQWDREQKKEDIAGYLLEEAYEVIGAIEKGEAGALKEELGDLLFQIIFLASLAEEKDHFDLAEVMQGVREKMIRRHPHVFGNRSVRGVSDIKDNWHAIKKIEKGETSYRERLEGITRALPALLRAEKISKEAAKAGFDWEKTADVLAKLEEELGELKEAMKTGSHAPISEELGDMLFSLVNLCRFLEVDAETALRHTTDKFVRRFSFIEDELRKKNRTPDDATPSELDRLWEEAKKKHEVRGF